MKLESYKKNKNIFFHKLKYLEIVKDLIKFKNFKLFIKIINYPLSYKMIKLLIIFLGMVISKNIPFLYKSFIDIAKIKRFP